MIEFGLPIKSLGTKVGILGGGQLAQMLAMAAHEYGLCPHVFSEHKNDPAAQVVHFHTQGNYHSIEQIKNFISEVDFVSFESEFLEMDLLFDVYESQKKIFPSPPIMKILQDRKSQKQQLVENHLPTAHFFIAKEYSEIQSEYLKNPRPLVLKKSRGGYDGYGTFYLRSQSDLSSIKNLFPGDFIVEDFIPFKRELALIMTRSSNPHSQIVTLPLVESKQTESRCDWILGPIEHPKARTLINKIKKLLNHINYVGTIAFELFDTGSELLINEVAPRVHNSGHFSQEALTQSQFLLHWKAGLGEILIQPELVAPAFCMVNLIGSSNIKPSLDHSQKPLTGHLHWYGKWDNRKGRKMGHINYVGKNKNILLKSALYERKKVLL